MRRVILAIMPVVMVLGCGNDNSTTPPPPSEITVAVIPQRMVLDLGETQQFTASVYGSANRRVIWTVQDVEGGNQTYGIIDTSGYYQTPVAEPGVDSIYIKALAQADTSKYGIGWAILVDPSKIYVSETGSDSTGTGSKQNPYRSIHKALSLVQSNQTVVVRPGQYDVSSGEVFPLSVPSGVIVTGAGVDSTYVIGTGGSSGEAGSVFTLNGDAITVEKMDISTVDHNGVGVWVYSGILVKVKNNNIGPNYIGIATVGTSPPRPIIESNVISGDSIGIYATQASAPIVRNNQITDCGNIGIDILDISHPDMGTNDSTDAGGNTIQNCGPNNHWLIYNSTADSIWAVGNSWVFPNPVDNDQFIYDDDEDVNSGPVLLINQ